MEQQYFNSLSATGLATTVAFLAVSLVPSTIHVIQPEKTNSYEQYIKSKISNYDYAHTSKDKESKVLVSFAQRLFENSKDDDSEIAKVTSDGFWEFHENF